MRWDFAPGWSAGDADCQVADLTILIKQTLPSRHVAGALSSRGSMEMRTIGEWKTDG
jgi:hypothetical protein